MSLSRRLLALAALTSLLAGCDADLLSPDVRSSAASARAALEMSLSSGPRSDTQLDLGWNDLVSNESAWEVHRSTTGSTGSFALLKSVGANSTSYATYSDSGLTALTAYCYKVRSFRKSGKNVTYAGFSNVSCATTFGPPAAPSDIAAVPGVGTITFITVSWTDRADNEQGFRVERAETATGPWSALGTVDYFGRSYSDGNLAWEQQFCYRVVAFNAYGEAASNADCTSIPKEPASLSVTSATAQGIDLSWTDASNVEDGFAVQRRVAAGAWAVAANLAANTVSMRDAGVTADTVYEYRVRATRDGGFSDFSPTVRIAAASRAPDAPSLQSASPTSSSSIYMRWNNESPLATDFRVERSTGGNGTWLAIATVAPGNTGYHGEGNYEDTGLTADQQVCFRIIARNAVGESPPSNIDCSAPPAAPSNLTYSDGHRVGTWTDNSSIEDGYFIAVYSCTSDRSWCGYEDSRVLPPNTTTFGPASDIWGRDLYVEAVCAMRDGGLSDCVYEWMGSQANSLMSTTGGSSPRSTQVASRLIDRLKLLREQRANRRPPLQK